jgi:16S rRNA (guanine966-N2)-methyltransferase
MRVITGRAKGTILFSLDPRTVPLSDRAKSALFSIIEEKIPEAFVLDMYAGSGALGIECLSRGASFVQFFEISKKAIEGIEKNLLKTHFKDQAEIVNVNVEKHLDRFVYELFDIIFICPPYPSVKFHVVQEAVRHLKPFGILIFEHDKKETYTVPAGVEKIDERKYGIVCFEIYQKKTV